MVTPVISMNTSSTTVPSQVPCLVAFLMECAAWYIFFDDGIPLSTVFLTKSFWY